MAVPLSMRQVESEPQAARRFVSGANKPIVKAKAAPSRKWHRRADAG